jgi:class 3 adenylate cyclase
MPDLDGFAVCQRLRAMPAMQAVPIVMVTSLDARGDRVLGLEAGADDFLTKPLVKEELWARVRSLLRVKTLFDESQRQREQLAAWSSALEQRVAEKVREVDRLMHLKRFFSPALASRLVAAQDDGILRSHRCNITVLFADLRGFTSFAERAEPAVLMAMLQSFHAAMGALIFEHEGTLERFTGDGFMVFFNDPNPQPDHCLRAVRLAHALREAARALLNPWRGQGGPVGMGIGVSCGWATLGAIGFEGRLDYAAIGPVTNRAARLCASAWSDEILACEDIWHEIQSEFVSLERRPVQLRGIEGNPYAHVLGLRAPE